MHLPAYPWETRPTPLTADEVCTALIDADGDLSAAAARLKVGTLVLRKFINSSARAAATIRELRQLEVDLAERGLREAIRDPDSRRKDWAIRYHLNSANARDRGWASDDTAATASRTAQPVLLLPVALWEDGTVLSPPAHKVLELTASPQPTNPKVEDDPSHA